ncbi:hypothetical protein [Procambarus clarkii virus]|nr:hypothetical protein [Procambarus clarkii virus]
MKRIIYTKKFIMMYFIGMAFEPISGTDVSGAWSTQISVGGCQ